MKVWICWDLNNGHWQEHCYLWVFPTRAEARKHHKWQHRQKAARLSAPKQTIVDYLVGHKDINYYHVNEVVGIKIKHPTYPEN